MATKEQIDQLKSIIHLLKPGDRLFAQSLVNAYNTPKGLSVKQEPWVQKLIDRVVKPPKKDEMKSLPDVVKTEFQAKALNDLLLKEVAEHDQAILNNLKWDLAKSTDMSAVAIGQQNAEGEMVFQGLNSKIVQADYAEIEKNIMKKMMAESIITKIEDGALNIYGTASNADDSALKFSTILEAATGKKAGKLIDEMLEDEDIVPNSNAYVCYFCDQQKAFYQKEGYWICPECLKEMEGK
jgi:hypothetical protein